MKNTVLTFIVNLGLLFFGSILAFTGLLIQINYHMGNHGAIDINNRVFGIDYPGWSVIHKMAVIFISIFITLHIVRHWKWYITIIRKKLMAKNRQVIILSIVFILTAITGYMPWFIKLKGGDEMIRKFYIEIHDKLALILFVFLVLHVLKRLKWFASTLRKLKLSE